MFLNFLTQEEIKYLNKIHFLEDNYDIALLAMYINALQKSYINSLVLLNFLSPKETKARENEALEDLLDILSTKLKNKLYQLKQKVFKKAKISSGKYAKKILYFISPWAKIYEKDGLTRDWFESLEEDPILKDWFEKTTTNKLTGLVKTYMEDSLKGLYTLANKEEVISALLEKLINSIKEASTFNKHINEEDALQIEEIKMLENFLLSYQQKGKEEREDV
jgi:predicted transcriptional regulator